VGCLTLQATRKPPGTEKTIRRSAFLNLSIEGNQRRASAMGYLWHLAGRAWLNCVVGSSITGRGLLKSRSCLTQALRQGFETGFEEVETAARFTSGSATFFVLKKSNLPQP
jgi:hypothetical protein